MLESASCVRCVLKTGSRANVPCVLTCSRTRESCVLTCSRAKVPCVLTCSRANVPCVVTCQRALRTYIAVGKCAMYISVKFIARLVVLFHFHQF